MKAYVVVWDDEATLMLADIFVRALIPNLLWPAQHRVDRWLEQQPRNRGIELSEGLWQLIEPPLKIFYEINDVKRVVTVTHVELI